MGLFFRLFLRMGGWSAGVLGLIGAGVLVYGLQTAASGRALSAAEISTEATVVRKHFKARTPGTTAQATYQLVLAYNTGKGMISETVRVPAALYNTTEKGATLEVYYDPSAPQRFELTRGQTLQAGQSARLYGILLLLATGAIGFYFARRARKAKGLLRHGARAEGVIYEIEQQQKSASLRFGFTAPDGQRIEATSFRAKPERFAGLTPKQKITVLYDKAKPEFAFWEADLQ